MKQFGSYWFLHLFVLLLSFSGIINAQNNSDEKQVLAKAAALNQSGTKLNGMIRAPLRQMN